MENKTALQVLIEYLEKEHKGVVKDEANGFITKETRKDFQYSLEVAIKKAESLLSKEKEQIETALLKGNTLESYGFIDKKYAENYYAKTYKTDEK